jgi:ABC-type uncharacterized transport system involved in gliding motility auxiliary subunit
MGKVQRLNLQAGVKDKSIIVFAGGRSKSLALSSLYEMDWGQRFARIRSFNAEGLLVSAILELTEEKPPTVYFAKGHGASEGKIERGGREDEGGLFWLANRLKERENIEAKPLNLVQAKEIPEDAKILVIHRPATKYGEKEILLLRDFLKRGGRLCVMVDALDAKGFVETGLGGLLGEWGLKLGRNFVLAVGLTPFGRTVIDRPEIQGPDYGSHPIVDKLKKEECTCRFGLTRTVDKIENAEARLEITPLITLSEKGWWAETSAEQIKDRRVRPDPEDPQENLILAQAVKASVAADVPKRISPETRLVVFGSAEFVEDGSVQNGSNEDLFIGALLWMIEREQNIGIGAKSLSDRRVTLDEGQQRLFFWVCIVALPALGVILGLSLWFIRRK